MWDWLVAGLLLWMFLACCFPLFDADLFWHLKTGEWILQNGSIPGYDLYTFTDFDKRWIDLQWGFEVVSAVLYRIGGANLLILTKAFVLTLALGIGCYGGGFGLRGWQRVLCWLLPAITISPRGYRPEIVTVLCLATWLAIVRRLESRPRWIWILPALQVFWINFHALFILGLVVGACYMIDYLARQTVDERWGLGPKPRNVHPSMLTGAASLCVGAALVNPYLEEGTLFPFVLWRKFTGAIDQEFYSSHINEFEMPIHFLRTHGLASLHLDALIVLWLAAAVSFIAIAMRARFSVFRTLLFAAFSFLAWKASRNANIFSIVAGFVLAENVSEFFVSRQPNRDGDHKLSSKRGYWPKWGTGLVLVSMIAAVLTGEWNRLTGKVRPFRLGEAKARFPHDAARFLGRPGFPKYVFASDFCVASVYTYHNAPEGRVFMDGRLEVCTRQTFERFEEIKNRMAEGDPRWAELLRANLPELPAIMLDTRGSFPLIEAVMMTPGWRLVFADRAAAVLIEVRLADALQLPAVSIMPMQFSH